MSYQNFHMNFRNSIFFTTIRRAKNSRKFALQNSLLKKFAKIRPSKFATQKIRVNSRIKLRKVNFRELFDWEILKGEFSRIFCSANCCEENWISKIHVKILIAHFLCYLLIISPFACIFNCCFALNVTLLLASFFRLHGKLPDWIFRGRGSI